MYLQYFLSGIIASQSIHFLSPAEKNILKVFLYMRAINAFIQLAIYLMRKNKKNLGECEDEGDKKQSVLSTLSDILSPQLAFTSTLVTIVVYGYVVEPDSMNKGMQERIH